MFIFIEFKLRSSKKLYSTPKVHLTFTTISAGIFGKQLQKPKEGNKQRPLECPVLREFFVRSEVE